ncbi:hypothetical protein COLO4_01873 [Corchorus olitorius]|uniref:Uncharacterized protein n=1 Tax=Corchorus olitorius TaxID=93759 RepID=A0A1R3L1W7_9ROSI|nr:hypothetical protein COLO4_01873 [Corchorus olitorius]
MEGYCEDEGSFVEGSPSVGDGTSLRFWLDWWLGLGPLIDNVVGEPPAQDLALKVSNFLIPDGLKEPPFSPYLSQARWGLLLG